MSGHTPGPWQLETVKTSCGLCHKVGPFPWREGKDNHACIYDDNPPPGGRPELVANARLIAAAPDLLEALVRIAGLPVGGPHISAEDGMSAALTTVDRIREISVAAISRAEGRTPDTGDSNA